MKNTKKTKRTLQFFAAWDYEFEEQEFNRMSEQGWQLVRGGSFTQKYEYDDSGRSIRNLHRRGVPRGNAQTLEECLLHFLLHIADQYLQFPSYHGND